METLLHGDWTRLERDWAVNGFIFDVGQLLAVMDSIRQIRYTILQIIFCLKQS